MLQSEFYDRTHVTLSGDDYADVENIYNNVKMLKDDFCKHWVEEKENPLFKELAAAFCKQTEELLQTQSDHKKVCNKYEDEIESIVRKYDSEIESIRKDYERILAAKEEEYKSFGRKIVANLDDESRIYDICEEEFTLDFICKVKLEENIDLEQHEREHLLEKL